MMKFFKHPVFEGDKEKTESAKLLYQIIRVIWVLPILLVAIIIFSGRTEVLPAAIVISIILITMTFVIRMGYVHLASAIMTGMIILVFGYADIQNAGNIQPSTLITAIAIIMSGLLLGRRAPLAAAILIAVSHGIIVYLQLKGFIELKSAPAIGPENIVITGVMILMIGFLYQFVISRLQIALDQARKNEEELQISNSELEEIKISLEQRVTERTVELSKVNQYAQKRANQFQAITEVTRAINATKKLQNLLPQITEVINEKFDFYHVGIFLSDAANQYAILSASNSEGGKRMLARGHQLRIGEQGIVGHVTKTGAPLIALDVGVDANYFNNPELPLTHSEMALPLKIEDQVIGTLDIQSTEINAFSSEDIEALATLADQVSLAIQNARLFDQTEKTLAEADAIQRQYIRETWGQIQKEEKLSGYRYSVAGVIPLDEEKELIEAKQKKNWQEISVPIVLRNETIGTLSVQVPKSEHVGTDQLDLIKAVAERVALSAENARLFEETTRRAERERVISDIAAKIGTSVRTESILQTTARELSQILNGADILIKLDSQNTVNDTQQAR